MTMQQRLSASGNTHSHAHTRCSDCQEQMDIWIKEGAVQRKGDKRKSKWSGWNEGESEKSMGENRKLNGISCGLRTWSAAARHTRPQLLRGISYITLKYFTKEYQAVPSNASAWLNKDVVEGYGSTLRQMLLGSDSVVSNRTYRTGQRLCVISNDL